MVQRSSRGAVTLPQEYFTSVDLFQEETERIFMQDWLCAGRSSQIPNPGSYILVQVLKESIIVTRDNAGHARAHYNVCRHRGTQLCEETQGQFQGKIQCPYHKWTYSLEGDLIGAPNMTGGLDHASFALRPVAVTEWQGFLFLNLSKKPQPFENVFAPLMGLFQPWRLPELQIAHTITYEIEANWKLIFQNYSECYHCPTVHPMLAKLTPYRSATNNFEDGPFLGGPMRISVQGGSMTVDGQACASPLCDEGQDLVYYYTLFPSMFLSLHPDYVLVHRLERISPNQTRIICEWLFHPEEMSRTGFSPSSAVEFWDITNKQDWHVCELSQKGISSRGYVPGPYSNLESLLAAFDREYLQRMNALAPALETVGA